MSKKPKNFKKIRSPKNVKIGDELVDVKFVMGIFGRISEYRYQFSSILPITKTEPKMYACADTIVCRAKTVQLE